MVNTATANSTVDGYSKNVDTMPKSEIDRMFREAEQYNAELANVVRTDDMPDFSPKDAYYDILNVGENGMMGSIEIPTINVRLPIYHGTDKEFLDEGAGHLIGTSFPIGGLNTHAVISAHTALPGKMLFDKLTEVKEGDVFYVKVLDRELEYKVTDIQVVLPTNGKSLNIVKDKDLVTLVTCTPYSINTHRLLVTGERVMKDNTDSLTDTNDDTDSTTTEITTSHTRSFNYVYILIGFGVFVIGLVVFVVLSLKRKDKSEEKEKEQSE